VYIWMWGFIDGVSAPESKLGEYDVVWLFLLEILEATGSLPIQQRNFWMSFFGFFLLG